MTATKMSAELYLPEKRSLRSLEAAAEGCRGCSLFENATQTVFGHGKAKAPIMLVGEQPGDQEDRAGLPFVGPAGRLLARALDDAGIDPAWTYQTNAVKHFKFTRKGGKRRIHQKPNRTEVVACRPWLLAEIEAVRPQVIVCLGATAAQSLLGASFRVSVQRGEVLALPSATAASGPAVVATVHPSAVLRDRSDRHDEAYQAFVDDLRSARSAHLPSAS
jgi:uracil-DNA glycosylase family protein